MEDTDSIYEKIIGFVVVVVLVSLLIFVVLAQSSASIQTHAVIRDLFQLH
jgi:hypothetical protein